MTAAGGVDVDHPSSLRVYMRWREINAARAVMLTVGGATVGVHNER